MFQFSGPRIPMNFDLSSPQSLGYKHVNETLNFPGMYSHFLLEARKNCEEAVANSRKNHTADADHVKMEDLPQRNICVKDHRAMVKMSEKSMCFNFLFF